MDLKGWMEMLVKCQHQDKNKAVRMLVDILVKSTKKRLTGKNKKSLR